MLDAKSTRTIRRLEKKTNYKVQKCVEKLFKDTGILCIQDATKIIYVGNAGLNTGLTEEKLIEIFSVYGPIEKVIMDINKTYSFVEFTNIANAKIAFENINGKIKINSSDNTPLYLAFSPTTPHYNNPWTTPTPPGLILLENFINENEEELLSSLVENNPNNSATLKHRKVKHFGFEFDYDNNKVKKEPLDEPIPFQTDFLFQRLKNDFDIEFKPDQLTVNSYSPGQGIPLHVDTHSVFGDILLCLSIGSGIVMDFKNKDDIHFSIYLPNKSLLVLSGESRYAWRHGISSRHTDVISTPSGLSVKKRSLRSSFTFRTISKTPCQCSYNYYCDSSKVTRPIQFKQNIAGHLENVLVHKVYNEIASHFSETRHKAWPKVSEFIKSLSVGSILIDIGCGNGKYLGQNLNIFELGCERSENLAKICQERNLSIFQGDCLALPLRSGCADACISIAVFHHLSTKQRRIQAIEEMIRILRPGGKGLIYVWAKNQISKDKKSTYIKQERKNKTLSDNPKETSSQINCDNYLSNTKSILENIEGLEEKEQLEDLVNSLPVHTNRTNFQHQDLLVPWKLKNEVQTFMRYYHVFEEYELELLCKSFENIQIIDSYYDEGNWCVSIKKM